MEIYDIREIKKFNLLFFNSKAYLIKYFRNVNRQFEIVNNLNEIMQNLSRL